MLHSVVKDYTLKCKRGQKKRGSWVKEEQDWTYEDQLLKNKLYAKQKEGQE